MFEAAMLLMATGLLFLGFAVLSFIAEQMDKHDYRKRREVERRLRREYVNTWAKVYDSHK